MATDHEHREPADAPPDAAPEVFTAHTHTQTTSASPAAQASPAGTHEPGDRPPHEHGHEHGHGPHWGSLLQSAAVALIFGGLGAWGYSRFLAKPAPPPPETAKAEPAEPPKLSSDKDFVDLKSGVDRLSTQIEQLQSQVAAAPKNKTRLDVESLKSRFDKLESASVKNTAASEKLDAFDERIDGLVKRVEALGDDVSALKSQQLALTTGGASATKPDGTTRRASARPAPVSDEGRALARGEEQFAKGRFDEALESFRKAREDDPDDARVWYYSALAQGFSSGDWTGEAERLARKGAEREQAGTPKAEEIDAAFAGLNKKTRDWLDYYRHHSK